ncbi:MAG TPA: hypothetical protein VGH99_03565 [Pseudonocardia sp.]|jgi:hypothetical protein
MVGFGIFLGCYLGRWWAVRKRARYDQERAWAQRKNYRYKENWPG